ncbi:MAG: glycosyltransferase [Planctomycetia bacterium]|nr:glycosyltransferase [Planctomycetia bacterium]
MRANPTVSVGMPVYNGERYLAKAIDSILAQTYADFELIISDNASLDRTQDIAHDYARRDSRISYIRQPANIGAPKNFRMVLDKARGQYFKWASANDLCDPDLLRLCKAVLDQRADVVLCFGKAVAIDDHGELVRPFDESFAIDDVRPSRRFAQVVDHLGVNNVYAGLFRAETLRRTKPEQAYPSADLVLIAELALYGKFHEVPHVLFYRREAPGSATKFRTKEEIIELRSPGARSRGFWPLWRCSLGQFSAALRSPITMSEKAAICAHLLRRYYWNRQGLWRELCANLWQPRTGS